MDTDPAPRTPAAGTVFPRISSAAPAARAAPPNEPPASHSATMPSRALTAALPSVGDAPQGEDARRPPRELYGPVAAAWGAAEKQLAMPIPVPTSESSALEVTAAADGLRVSSDTRPSHSSMDSAHSPLSASSLYSSGAASAGPAPPDAPRLSFKDRTRYRQFATGSSTRSSVSSRGASTRGSLLPLHTGAEPQELPLPPAPPPLPAAPAAEHTGATQKSAEAAGAASPPTSSASAGLAGGTKLSFKERARSSATASGAGSQRRRHGPYSPSTNSDLALLSSSQRSLPGEVPQGGTPPAAAGAGGATAAAVSPASGQLAAVPPRGSGASASSGTATVTPSPPAADAAAAGVAGSAGAASASSSHDSPAPLEGAAGARRVSPPTPQGRIGTQVFESDRTTVLPHIGSNLSGLDTGVVRRPTPPAKSASRPSSSASSPGLHAAPPPGDALNNSLLRTPVSAEPARSSTSSPGSTSLPLRRHDSRHSRKHAEEPSPRQAELQQRAAVATALRRDSAHHASPSRTVSFGPGTAPPAGGSVSAPTSAARGALVHSGKGHRDRGKMLRRAVVAPAPTSSTSRTTSGVTTARAGASESLSAMNSPPLSSVAVPPTALSQRTGPSSSSGERHTRGPSGASTPEPTDDDKRRRSEADLLAHDFVQRLPLDVSPSRSQTGPAEDSGRRTGAFGVGGLFRPSHARRASDIGVDGAPLSGDHSLNASTTALGQTMDSSVLTGSTAGTGSAFGSFAATKDNRRTSSFSSLQFSMKRRAQGRARERVKAKKAATAAAAAAAAAAGGGGGIGKPPLRVTPGPDDDEDEEGDDDDGSNASPLLGPAKSGSVVWAGTPLPSSTMVDEEGNGDSGHTSTFAVCRGDQGSEEGGSEGASSTHAVHHDDGVASVCETRGSSHRAGAVPPRSLGRRTGSGVDDEDDDGGLLADMMASDEDAELAPKRIGMWETAEHIFIPKYHRLEGGESAREVVLRGLREAAGSPLSSSETGSDMAKALSRVNSSLSPQSPHGSPKAASGGRSVGSACDAPASESADGCRAADGLAAKGTASATPAGAAASDNCVSSSPVSSPLPREGSSSLTGPLVRMKTDYIVNLTSTSNSAAAANLVTSTVAASYNLEPAEDDPTVDCKVAARLMFNADHGVMLLAPQDEVERYGNTASMSYAKSTTASPATTTASRPDDERATEKVRQEDGEEEEPDGACQCDEAFITKDSRGMDYSKYNAHDLYDHCVCCHRRPASFLCLHCFKAVCPTHVRRHHEKRPTSCSLFLNILDIMTSFDRIFWCERCRQFTWKYTEIYDPLVDQIAYTRGTYLPHPARDIHCFGVETVLREENALTPAPSPYSAHSFRAFSALSASASPITAHSSPNGAPAGLAVAAPRSMSVSAHDSSHMPAGASTAITHHYGTAPHAAGETQTAVPSGSTCDSPNVSRGALNPSTSFLAPTATEPGVPAETTTAPTNAAAGVSAALPLPPATVATACGLGTPAGLSATAHPIALSATMLSTPPTGATGSTVSVPLPHRSPMRVGDTAAPAASLSALPPACSPMGEYLDRDAASFAEGNVVPIGAAVSKLSAIGASVQGWRSTQEDAEAAFLVYIPALSGSGQPGSATAAAGNKEGCPAGGSPSPTADDASPLTSTGGGGANTIPMAVFCVFDGHGGDAVAKLAANHFEFHLRDAIARARPDDVRARALLFYVNTEAAVSPRAKARSTVSNPASQACSFTSNHASPGPWLTAGSLLAGHPAGSRDGVASSPADGSRGSRGSGGYRFTGPLLVPGVAMAGQRSGLGAASGSVSGDTASSCANPDSNPMGSGGAPSVLAPMTSASLAQHVATEEAQRRALEELTRDGDDTASAGNERPLGRAAASWGFALSTSSASGQPKSLPRLPFVGADAALSAAPGSVHSHSRLHAGQPASPPLLAAERSSTAVRMWEQDNLVTASSAMSLGPNGLGSSASGSPAGARVGGPTTVVPFVNGVGAPRGAMSPPGGPATNGMAAEASMSSLYAGAALSPSALVTVPEVEMLRVYFASIMEEALLSLDDYLRKTPEGVRGDYNCVGCTACIVGVTANFILCANVGDSGACFFNSETIESISIKHRLTDPKEQERVRAAGYRIDNNRIEGMLAVPRALGDFDFKQCGGKSAREQAVAAVPDVTIRPVPTTTTAAVASAAAVSTGIGVDSDAAEDRWGVILACDGVWDTATLHQIHYALVNTRNDLGVASSATEAVMRARDLVLHHRRGPVRYLGDIIGSTTSNPRGSSARSGSHDSSSISSPVSAVEPRQILSAQLPAPRLSVDAMKSAHEEASGAAQQQLAYGKPPLPQAPACPSSLTANGVGGGSPPDKATGAAKNGCDDDDDSASDGTSYVEDLGGDLQASDGVDARLLIAAAGVFAQCVAPTDNEEGIGLDNCSLIIVERRA